MHPRIEELLEYIDAERTKLRATVDSVPLDHRSKAPTPDSWTVAQVVEHLAVVERRITAMFRKNVSEGRATGIGPETETSSQIVALNPEQFADRATKFNGPPAVQPSGDMDVYTALAALDSARHEFRLAIVDADGVALGELSAPHPVFGPLSLYRWIGFIGGHDARHAKQIREIAASLAENPA